MRVKKSNKANLENKRGMFLQIGIIVSLSIVFLAFEWTTVKNHKIDWNSYADNNLIEEMTEITIHKKKLPEMPKPKIIQTIEFVDNKADVEVEIDISAEITDDTKNDIAFIIKEEPDIVAEEVQIFTIAEKQPEFPGGEGALQSFLINNLKYPQQAIEAGISGTVYVSFIVWDDGSVRDIKLKRGIGGGCDEEALKIVEMMPNWNPGIQLLTPVNVQMILPVSFKLIK